MIKSTEEIIRFIKKQKISIVTAIDENGYPSQKAMFAPRRIDGNTVFYFSTNTSSQKVDLFSKNPKASIYFYHQGKIVYTGILLKGTMEILTDIESKKSIWKKTDTLYYHLGVTDPDYCVLKFTAESGRIYEDLKTEDFILKDM